MEKLDKLVCKIMDGPVKWMLVIGCVYFVVRFAEYLIRR